MPHELDPRIRRPLAVLLLGTLLLVARPAPAKQAPPPLVAVAIVVDQLAGWVALDRLPKLPKNGGFARLLTTSPLGLIEYEHALTETAPAHAALYTAKTPRETGITANDVRREHAATEVASLLQDPNTQIIGASGPIPGRPGISLKQLLVPTLSETLLERDPKSVVVAISTKDRGAAFAGARVKAGQRPSDVVWWDDRTSQVVTSSAFAPKLPAWVSQPKLPAEFRWEVSPEVKSLSRLPDDQAGEATDLGGGTFPHVFPANGKSFRVSAYADKLTVDLALAAVNANRTPSHPMLVALSFSRYDYVGHRFGPESWEAWQALLDLDRELARLFKGLDAALGEDTYSVVLTADHGVAPLPESVSATSPWCGAAENPFDLPCSPGTRLSTKTLARKSGAKRVADALVYGASDPTALETEPGIAKVLKVCDLDPKRSTLERLVYNSMPPCAGARNDQIVPDYYVVATPGSFFDDPPDVAGHGTPYLYDRTVPLLGGNVGDGTFRSFYRSVWRALTGE